MVAPLTSPNFGRVSSRPERVFAACQLAATFAVTDFSPDNVWPNILADNMGRDSTVDTVRPDFVFDIVGSDLPFDNTASPGLAHKQSLRAGGGR